MADNPILKALPLFVSPAEAWKSKPFTVRVGKDTWTAATDGQMILAAKTKGDFPPLVEDRVEALVEILQARAVKPCHIINTSDLRAWVGEVSEPRAFVEEGRPEGILFNIVFDKRRIACLLEPIPTAVMKIWESTKAVGVKSLMMEGPGWRAVLAGMDLPVGDQPRFFEADNQRLVFNAAMQLDG